MDKYDLVIDIVEHPEKYTAEQLNEILSDAETKEIYNLLCKTDSAIVSDKKIDVDLEWDVFSKKYSVGSRSRFFWFGSRVASIVVIVATSLVAVAAGIVVTVSVIGHKQSFENEDVNAGQSVVEVTEDIDTMVVKNDTVGVVRVEVIFENESLEKIMSVIAYAYNVEIQFDNKEAAALHLYYKLDTSLTLGEVIDQFNTFEQIHIQHKGKTLKIN
ncbi:MAG: DUF4974 domain-containing protein [Muribaculaceae bacterium]|nr:DUF4974 domain-containing protein [Muribaculaceae bacterium]MDE6643045.1 DUF4974 domain-containing protein [Muribaculaceae bacterium]